MCGKYDFYAGFVFWDFDKSSRYAAEILLKMMSLHMGCMADLLKWFDDFERVTVLVIILYIIIRLYVGDCAGYFLVRTPCI